MASSQPSDLELVVFNFIRNNYEAKHKKNVPMALKYLTLQFSNRFVECSLLSLRQDIDFFKLLLTKLTTIRRFQLLFRASDHNYSADKFHEYCDNKPGTISIIKSSCGNIFGGYTSKSWTSNHGPVGDENAFLFLLKSDFPSIQQKCPLLLELKELHVGVAIFCDEFYGPTFGAGFDIIIRDNCNEDPDEVYEFDTNYSDLSSYSCEGVLGLCGDLKEGCTNHFQVIDYEVIQIIQ